MAKLIVCPDCKGKERVLRPHNEYCYDPLDGKLIEIKSELIVVVCGTCRGSGRILVFAG